MFTSAYVSLCFFCFVVVKSFPFTNGMVAANLAFAKFCHLCAFHCLQIVHNIFIIHPFVLCELARTTQVHFGTITSQLPNNFALKNITNVSKFRLFEKFTTENVRGFVISISSN